MPDFQVPVATAKGFELPHRLLAWYAGRGGGLGVTVTKPTRDMEEKVPLNHILVTAQVSDYFPRRGSSSRSLFSPRPLPEDRIPRPPPGWQGQERSQQAERNNRSTPEISEIHAEWASNPRSYLGGQRKHSPTAPRRPEEGWSPLCDPFQGELGPAGFPSWLLGKFEMWKPQDFTPETPSGRKKQGIAGL